MGFVLSCEFDIVVVYLVYVHFEGFLLILKLNCFQIQILEVKLIAVKCE